MRTIIVGVLALLCFTVGGRADAQPVPQTQTGTIIITLGTAGGPRPRVHRAQSANMLLVNGTPYLIDAGENVVRRIVGAGVDFLKVGRVFITHPHSDHTLGLPALLASQWEFQRRDPVEIYGAPGTKKFVAGLIDFLEPNTEIRSSEGDPVSINAMISAHDSPPGVVYRDANVTVTAVENTHFNFPKKSPAYGKFHSYSYRFDTPGRSVVFTGDTGPSDAVVTLAMGVDVLVTEINNVDELLAAYKKNGTWNAKTPQEQTDWLRHQNEEHLSPQAVGELATKAGVKSVVLTHLTPSADPNDDYARLVVQVQKYYKGDVKVAKDLARF
jgi:ribonuclease BN (tRNA processing enzyme)